MSANPTGPLTLGHARNAAIGDALARLLSLHGLGRGARVLLQRRRRADGPLRRVRGGALPPGGRARGRGARGRLPRRTTSRSWPRTSWRSRARTSRTSRRDERLVRLRDGGRPARPRRGSEARSSGSGSRSTCSSPSEICRNGGRSTPRCERLRDRGYLYESEGRPVVPRHGVRRRQGPGRDPIQRRRTPTSRRTARTSSTSSAAASTGCMYVLGADHHGTVARLKGAAAGHGLRRRCHGDRPVPVGDRSSATASRCR